MNIFQEELYERVTRLEAEMHIMKAWRATVEGKPREEEQVAVPKKTCCQGFAGGTAAAFEVAEEVTGYSPIRTHRDLRHAIDLAVATKVAIKEAPVPAKPVAPSCDNCLAHLVTIGEKDAEIERLESIIYAKGPK